MAKRFQYSSLTGPVTIRPPAPKLGWLGSFPAIVPTVAVITTACIAASGAVLAFPPDQFPLDPSYQGWKPNYPAIVPGPTPLPTGMGGMSFVEEPSVYPPDSRPELLRWWPHYPDFIHGPKPLPVGMGGMVGGIPVGDLPLDPKFLSWHPTYPDFAKGPSPLPTYAGPWETRNPIVFRSTFAAQVLIGGVDWTRFVRMESVGIEDILNEQPNTARFTINTYDAIAAGLTLSIGASVVINFEPPQPSTTIRLFGGTIITTDQFETGDVRANISHNVTCQDGTYLLNRRLPIKRYTATSASVIVTDLISNFSTGFTVANVQAGLPSVSIDFDGSQTFAECLTSLANMIGGYWFPDYYNDIHFFITATGTPPDTINETNALSEDGAHHLRLVGNLNQIRTRVLVAGKSASVSIPPNITVPVGNTTLPISDQSTYNSGGGSATLGPQTVSYSGINSGAPADGATVAGRLQSIGSLSATQAFGLTRGDAGNLENGTYLYKVTVVNDKGDESEAGSASSGASIAVVTAPSAPSGIPTAGESGQLVSGVYKYKVTFVTDNNGETLPSAQLSVTITAISAAGSPAAAISGNGSLSVGNYSYAVAFGTTNGETALSFTAGVVVSQISNVNSVTITPTGSTGGALTPSQTYYYFATIYDTVGETIPAGTAPSVLLTAGQNAINLTGIPISADSRAVGRRIYRSAPGSPGGPYYLVGTLANNTATTFTDNLSVASASSNISRTPGLFSNTTGSATVSLTGVATSADARVTKRVIYRTLEGGSIFYKLTTIGDNVTTVYTDSTPDDSLSLNTTSSVATSANNGTISLSSIVVSADTRVLRRRIYRTLVGGSTFFLLQTIGDNTTTVYHDNTLDTTIASAVQPPGTSTADNGQMALSSIPLGPTGVAGANTTSRRIYRTKVGGSTDYFFVGTVGDNTTTIFTDNVADKSLGVKAPSTSDWRTLAGTTTLIASAVSNVFAETANGWIKVGSQIIFYGSRSSVTMSSVPASGLGAILADITAGTPITFQPFLKGIPASGSGSILYAINADDSLSIKVVRNDLAAQAILAALEGGDGIHEFPVNDSTLSTVTQCNARGDAELAQFGLQLKTLTYDTRDPKTTTGQDIIVNLLAPTSISLTVRIQTVSISQITTVMGKYPLYTVSASITKFSLQDVLRRLTLS